MTTGHKDKKGDFHPHSGSKSGVSENDVKVSVKGNNDVIKIETPKLHWTKELEKNKLITVDSQEIKMIAANRGSHFFDPATMRFFDSRLAGTGYKLNGDVYFITSEDSHIGSNHARKYTVRVMRKDGGRGVDDIGGFQAHDSLPQAKKALEKYLEAEMKNLAYVH